MAANNFAYPPPDAIAQYRAAESFFDAETKTADRLGVGAKKNGEVGTRPAFAGAVHGVKFATPQQARLARIVLARVIRA